MRPVTLDYDSNSIPELVCPQCGNPNLHQGVVRVYSRDEDWPSRLTQVDLNGNVTQIANAVGNPSDRRHGLTIAFECEHCDLLADLAIWQHKGVTFVEWLGTDKDEEPTT